MKKILCLMIALLMLSVGFSALAEDESVWDFDTYSYSLEGYTGAQSELVVPDMIQGCTVDILGVNAFNSASELTSIVMPETLRQIEDGALGFCENLTAATLNDGLLIIGDNCFIANYALTEITIPASVCYIGSNAFSDCSSLMSVTFKGECPAFAGYAFDWLPDEAVIYVPDDQFDAYYAAFERMGMYPNLQMSGENAIPAEISVVPEQFAFDAATGTITYYEGYEVRVDVPAEIDGVPVRAIGDEAFANRNYMCYLSLPDSVETIGVSAFEGCTRLLYVDFPENLNTIGNRAFAGSYQGWSLDLPAGVETIGDEAFEYAAKLSGELELPEGLRTVGSRAFANTYWLETVYVPESLETIGENAFVESSVSYVVFEGLQLPEMADNAFADCYNLADIDLHHKATKQQMLDMQARVDALGIDCRVWRMQNPEVDYIYDGLDTYENGVMTGYTGEQTHLRPYDTYDDVTVTELGDGAFKGNTTIEYFSVPYNDAFTTIGAEAFADSTLAQIDLFDSVTTINGGAFRNCANLTELTLPESVEFVGVESLYGCTGLKTLFVLCDPTVLPEDLFDVWPEDLEIYVGDNATDEQVKYLSKIAGRPFYCPVTRMSEELPELTAMPYEPLPGEDFWFDTEFARLDNYDGYELNLVLPREIEGEPLTMIGGGMMSRAASMDDFEAELPVVSVVIPETYTEIPFYAFANCESLETVVCYAPIERLEDSVFQNCTSLREVIFVNGVGSIGEYVFDGCPSLETVYVGPYVDSVGEFAFMDEFGEPVWSLENCITDPALMPDVDALLAAVEREPMAEPEPEAPAVPAVPVGEEGAPFFGLWIGTEMDMGGEVMSLSDWDMVMNLLLLEDGRMIAMDEEVTDWSVLDGIEAPGWRVENGVAIGDGCTMSIAEDGRLILDEDGFKVYFERSDVQIDVPAAPSAPAAQAQPEVPAAPAQSGTSSGSAAADASQYTEIKFVCVNADVSGYTMDASMLGGEYSLIFHDDGTATFVVVGNEMPGATWTQLDSGNFQIDFYGSAMEVVWTDEGFDMNYMDSMLMHFVPEV